MQFRDLIKQYNVLKPKIDRALIDTAASGAYVMGQAVKEVETLLAEYVGVKHCVACANGTDALTLALKTWNIGVGDAVFVPDFTFFASAEVVSNEGATPVFVDVNSDTFNIDPDSLNAAIEQTIKEGKLIPKVVIAVDLFGLPANYSEIRKVADIHNLYILEDGAQGFGGSVNNRKACSFGDISATSFFPAKPLGCYGDGGAVFTDNDEWMAILSSLRVHGKGSYKYDNVRIGMNSRLDTLQAAILKVKLTAFTNNELENINKASILYNECLGGIVKTPVVPKGYYSSWAQYTVVLNNRKIRNGLKEFLKKHDVPSMVYYPKPMHAQTAFETTNFIKESTPVSVKLCDTVLSLPIHPYISEGEINMVGELVKAYIQG